MSGQAFWAIVQFYARPVFASADQGRPVRLMEDEILKEFLAESWENLGRLDSEIVGLEKNPGDKELLASIFRTIHTIKGTCGFIGLTGLGAVAHSAENVLGKMRDGALAASQVTISPVLEAVDEIKFLLHGLEASGKEPARDNSDLIRRLDVIATGIEAALADAPVTAPLATASSVAPPAHSVPATVSVPAAAVAAATLPRRRQVATAAAKRDGGLVVKKVILAIKVS